MTHADAPHGHSRPVQDAGTARPTQPGRLRAWWNAAVGGVGVVVGLAPHVLHHVGFLAGFFASMPLVAGTGGTALFGVLGLVASVPLLLRLRGRFSSWWAPATALVIFAAMFSLSAFVIGPAISGESGAGEAPVDEPSPTPADHDDHHGA